jgi:hypothetical protein
MPRPAARGFNIHSPQPSTSSTPYGSPRLVPGLLAEKDGLYMMASSDFDVLDGADEFLTPANLSGRGLRRMETRVYIPSSPAVRSTRRARPGVCYHKAIGFSPQPRTPVQGCPRCWPNPRPGGPEPPQSHVSWEQAQRPTWTPLHIGYEHDSSCRSPRRQCHPSAT